MHNLCDRTQLWCSAIYRHNYLFLANFCSLLLQHKLGKWRSEIKHQKQLKESSTNFSTTNSVSRIELLNLQVIKVHNYQENHSSNQKQKLIFYLKFKCLHSEDLLMMWIAGLRNGFQRIKVRFTVTLAFSNVSLE